MAFLSVKRVLVSVKIECERIVVAIYNAHVHNTRGKTTFLEKSSPPFLPDIMGDG